MYFVSYVTLFILFVYIVAVHQCDGHKRHTQRSRRSQRDWWPYLPSYPSYDDYATKLREQQLLMEINERISDIMSKLNQKQQQQPVYVPVYVPYFMPSNGYSLPFNGNGNVYRPDSKPILPTTVTPLGNRAKSDDATSKQDKTLKVDLNLRSGMKSTEDNGIEFPQETDSTKSLRCDVATVACCRFSDIKEKQKCFTFYECSQTNNNMLGCRTDAINRAVETITNTYAPKKRHLQ